MSLPLIIRPEAEANLFEARNWYDEQRDDLGSEFLTEIDEVFDRIRDRPELYAEEYKEVSRVGTAHQSQDIAKTLRCHRCFNNLGSTAVAP